MSADRPTLSTFNHFTFKEEAHMRLWVAYWERHAEAFFEELAPLGCLRVSLNRVWNKEGLYKTSALFEYEKTPRRSRPVRNGSRRGATPMPSRRKWEASTP